MFRNMVACSLVWMDSTLQFQIGFWDAACSLLCDGPWSSEGAQSTLLAFQLCVLDILVSQCLGVQTFYHGEIPSCRMGPMPLTRPCEVMGCHGGHCCWVPLTRQVILCINNGSMPCLLLYQDVPCPRSPDLSRQDYASLCATSWIAVGGCMLFMYWYCPPQSGLLWFNSDCALPSSASTQLSRRKGAWSLAEKGVWAPSQEKGVGPKPRLRQKHETSHASLEFMNYSILLPVALSVQHRGPD